MISRTTTNNYRASFDAALRRLEEDTRLHPATRADILRFQQHTAAAGLSLGRQMKYLSDLRRVFSGSQKPAAEWSAEEVGGFLRRVDSSDYTFWTRYDYRITLRKFFRWLRGTEGCPPEVKFARLANKNLANKKLPAELLTEEEIGRMIAACQNARDAAFLACLYESGCRPDELGSIRLKHVQPDRHGFVLVVNGKTGMRRVRICLFAQHLAGWLDKHPCRDNPEAVLWANQKTDGILVPPMNGALNKLVKHAARRVGIRKRIYPYLFRHSRATFLASRLTEAQMNAVFGWQQGSDMPRTYVHLSGRDVDAALLQLAGVASADAQPRESILKPRVCVRCALSNPGTARFCSRCAAPLDSAEIMKFEDDALAAGRLVTDLLQNDPLLQAMVKERLKRKLMEEREASATPAPAMESRT